MRFFGKGSNKAKGSSAKKAKAAADKANGVPYDYKPRHSPRRPAKTIGELIEQQMVHGNKE